MNKVARFVTRGTGNDGLGPVDLILGTAFIDSVLKPNRVYEIQKIMGELIIVDVGPSALKMRNGMFFTKWTDSVDDILSHLGTPAYFILTEKESTQYNVLCNE